MDFYTRAQSRVAYDAVGWVSPWPGTHCLYALMSYLEYNIFEHFYQTTRTSTQPTRPNAHVHKYIEFGWFDVGAS